MDVHRVAGAREHGAVLLEVEHAGVPDLECERAGTVAAEVKIFLPLNSVASF